MFNHNDRHGIIEPNDGEHLFHYIRMGQGVSDCVVLLKEPLYHCAMCKKMRLFKLPDVKRHIASNSKNARYG